MGAPLGSRLIPGADKDEGAEGAGEPPVPRNKAQVPGPLQGLPLVYSGMVTCLHLSSVHVIQNTRTPGLARMHLPACHLRDVSTGRAWLGPCACPKPSRVFLGRFFWDEVRGLVIAWLLVLAKQGQTNGSHCRGISGLLDRFGMDDALQILQSMEQGKQDSDVRKREKARATALKRAGDE